MKYGTKLKSYIKKLGYTQNGYAAKRGIANSTMSVWVNSEYPPLEAIEMVCIDSGIPLYEFFMDDEQRMKTMPEDIDPIQVELLRTLNALPNDKHIAIIEAFCKIAETFVK